jgi:type I restriction enzyme S subunit
MSTNIWPSLPLSEIFRIQTEQVLPFAQPNLDFVHFSIPALDATGQAALEKGAEIESNKFLIDRPSVLVSKLNPRKPRVTVVEKSGQRYCASTEFICYQPKRTAEYLPFWGAYFRSNQFARRLEQVAIGSTNSHTRANPKETLGWLVPDPDPKEKLKIGEILRALDEHIHHLQLMIEKLKQVKQGLLHDLLTCGIDSNGELRRLRRQTIEPSHLLSHDEMPSGWTFGTLDKWLKQPPKNGYSPQEAGSWTGKLMLGLGCLTVNGFVPSQIKNAPLEDRRVDAALLNDGDLLMSRSNTRDLVGLAGVYSSVGAPCAYPDLMMRLVPTEETSARFLELVLRSSYVRKQIQAAASGTSDSMAKINSTIVRNLRVAMPKRPEQDTILERVEPLGERLALEAQRLKVLVNVKAGLTDDLLTGRVRVTSLLEK